MSVDHSGHRQRLKTAYRESGLMSFSPHEVIELMLYSALPRRDVNEQAHKIDDFCGGVSGLIRTGEEELISGCGLSQGAARTLRAYCECVSAYMAGGGPGRYLRTRGEFERAIVESGPDTACLLSSGREVLVTVKLPEKDKIRFLCERTLAYDASAVVLTGPTDIDTGELKQALELIDARLETAVTLQ